jgi:hypothetical protein
MEPTFAELLPKATPAGEVTCLNCGRLLAHVVHEKASDSLRLRRLRGQPAVQVRVAGRSHLRCAHCHGHALVTLGRD